VVSKWIFYLREALLGFGRHPANSFSAVCAISASMLVLGLFFLVNLNVQRVLSVWESRKTVEVFLSDEVSESGWRELASRLAVVPGVRSVKYVSKDEALREFRSEIDADDLLKALDQNPLPASLRLELDEGSRNAPFMRALADTVSQWAGVEEVLFGGRWLERLDRFALGVKIGSIVVGIIVAASVILVVSNTIRLNVVSRRESLELMQLIGADRDFISVPIMIEGALESTLGTVIALVALSFGYRFAAARVEGLTFMGTLSFAAFIAFAVFLGWLGSFLSIRSALPAAGGRSLAHGAAGHGRRGRR